jgi:hypothetical protein
MYYMQINKNFVHQVGDQPRLYYDVRSTNYQDVQHVTVVYTGGNCNTMLNRVQKILPPLGFDPRTIQPVASRCTD